MHNCLQVSMVNSSYAFEKKARTCECFFFLLDSDRQGSLQSCFTFDSGMNNRGRNLFQVERFIVIVHLHNDIATRFHQPVIPWCDFYSLPWSSRSCESSKQIAAGEHNCCSCWQLVWDLDHNVPCSFGAYVAVPVVEDHPLHRHSNILSVVQSKPWSSLVECVTKVWSLSNSVNTFSGIVVVIIYTWQKGCSRSNLNDT